MEISLKDTLRTLRQKKNVTQEALANHLGITPQSVGKWERGEGFPDITLLPKIALFFGVTIDDLLNVGQARIDEAIEEYEKEAYHLRRAGEVEKEIELWEKAYAEFPSNYRVMRGLMYAITSKGVRPVQKEDSEKVIALGERILKESTDSRLREGAVQCLCYAYKEIGDKENALRYADMGGSFYMTGLNLRSTVLTGEEGLSACQSYLVTLLSAATGEAALMTTKVKFTDEEKIAAYKFGNDLIKLLYPDGNVGFEAEGLSRRCLYIAECYAKLKNAEETLEALEECGKYSVIYDTITEKMRYTAPMVNRLEYDPCTVTKNYTGNTCNSRLSMLSWKCFDFIREDPRFLAVQETLKKYAR